MIYLLFLLELVALCRLQDFKVVELLSSIDHELFDLFKSILGACYKSRNNSLDIHLRIIIVQVLALT